MRSRMEHEQGMSCCRWQTPPLSDIFKFLICQSVVIQSKGWRKRERMWEILLFCWESSKCFLVSFVSGAGTGHLILQWAVQSSDHCCAVNVSWSVQCLGENTCRWVKKKKASVIVCLVSHWFINQTSRAVLELPLNQRWGTTLPSEHRQKPLYFRWTEVGMQKKNWGRCCREKSSLEMLRGGQTGGLWVWRNPDIELSLEWVTGWQDCKTRPTSDICSHCMCYCNGNIIMITSRSTGVVIRPWSVGREQEKMSSGEYEGGTRREDEVL